METCCALHFNQQKQPKTRVSTHVRDAMMTPCHAATIKHMHTRGKKETKKKQEEKVMNCTHESSTLRRRYRYPFSVLGSRLSVSWGRRRPAPVIQIGVPPYPSMNRPALRVRARTSTSTPLPLPDNREGTEEATTKGTVSARPKLALVLVGYHN